LTAAAPWSGWLLGLEQRHLVRARVKPVLDLITRFGQIGRQQLGFAARLARHAVKALATVLLQLFIHGASLSAALG
jgi:hypothetical protein